MPVFTDCIRRMGEGNVFSLFKPALPHIRVPTSAEEVPTSTGGGGVLPQPGGTYYSQGSYLFWRRGGGTYLSRGYLPQVGRVPTSDGRGVPTSLGTPPQDLLDGGWYASGFHAEGLSCSRNFLGRINKHCA